MSDLKLSDQTSVALPIKNIVAIISAIVVAVWTYFGIVERLNRLETNEWNVENRSWKTDDTDNFFYDIIDKEKKNE